MTEKEWEELCAQYASDWRVRVGVGIDAGTWREKIGGLKEALHIDPDEKILSVLVKNTETNEVCAFDLEGNMDGTESLSFPVSPHEDEAGITPKEIN